MEQKRQISSAGTFLPKVVIPTLFYGLLIFALIGLTIEKDYGGIAGVLFILLIFGTLIYFGFVKLKSVSMDSENFYVSNYIRTIKIPISELHEVTQLTFPGNYRPIILHFKDYTRFGDKVMFFESMESTFSTSTSALTEQLRSLIKL